jgi:uncharacterized membrane protein required for colicin V production
MGLDVAFGVIILGAAFRGWFQGFVNQTVRLTSMVACVYLADPVRNYARPYVLPYLSSIQPDLIDRLLWWVSAVGAYVVMVGVATLIIKMTRRPEIPGISQKGKNDQFAGFMFGATKGLVIAAFLAHGIQSYGGEQVKAVSWAEEQVKTSWGLRWNETYKPVPKIWSSRPVQHFVNHIERMGIRKPEDLTPPEEGSRGADDSAVRTASRRSDEAASSHSEPDAASSPPAAAVESNPSKASESDHGKAPEPK